MEITNTMILTAITDLSGFVKVLVEDVKTLTEDMVEVKSDIAGMKEDISGIKVELTEVKEEVSSIKQEMKQINEKIGATHDLAIRIDDKVTILNGEFLGTRADVLALQRAR
ncbi:hypothetical protein [Sporosarcina sp. FSL K6-3457]|uniref:hypothetical protein n=1 Tax=Sporosarcina sp. FSL K6-3457 TaxID=2978204 RepID=UPI0030FB42B6